MSGDRQSVLDGVQKAVKASLDSLLESSFTLDAATDEAIRRHLGALGSCREEIRAGCSGRPLE